MENNEQSAPAEVAEATPVEAVEASGKEAEATPKDAAKQEKAVEAAVKRLNKIKIKVDGEETEETLPFDYDDNPATVEFLQKNLQLSKSAQRRMQEKAEYEKKVDQLVELLENSPELVLERAGKDPEKWAVEFLQKKIKESEMTPQEKELVEARAELTRIKKEREDGEKAQQERDVSAMREKAEQYYEQTILQALEKSGVPKTPKMIHAMAQQMFYAAENKSPIEVDELALMVKEDYIKEMRDYLKSSPDEFIEDMVGKDRLNDFRKKNIQALKKSAESVPTKITATGETSKQSSKEEKKGTLKISDFLRGV